jgi:hypothetical protein
LVLPKPDGREWLLSGNQDGNIDFHNVPNCSLKA